MDHVPGLVGRPRAGPTGDRGDRSGRGTDDLQVAASLYVQSYAYRVPASPSPPTRWGCRPRPATRPRSPSGSQRHRPASSPCSTPRAARWTPSRRWPRALLEEHLRPFVAAVRGDRHGSVQRLLWGNVASAIASIFGAVHAVGAGGDPAVREPRRGVPRRRRTVAGRSGRVDVSWRCPGRSAGTGTGRAAASGTRRTAAGTARTAASTTAPSWSGPGGALGPGRRERPP